MFPSIVASSCRMSNLLDDGKRPANDDGVEARASVGKFS